MNVPNSQWVWQAHVWFSHIITWRLTEWARKPLVLSQGRNGPSPCEHARVTKAMRKTCKYRLYPNNEQRRLLEQPLDACRWLYNRLLEERKTAWEQRQESVRLYDQHALLPALKAERPALAGVHSQVLQNVAVRMDVAVQAFLRRLKAGERLPPFPRRGPLRQRHLPPRAGRLPSRCGSSAPARHERGDGESRRAPAPAGHAQDGHHSTQQHRHVVRRLLVRAR